MEPPFDPPPDPAAPQPPPIEPRPIEPALEPRRDDTSLSALLSWTSEAWQRDLGPWVLAMLLYWLIGFGVPMVFGTLWGFAGAMSGSEPSTGFQWLDWTVEASIQVVQLVLGGVFTLGFWAMAIEGLRGERATVGMVFSQISKIWKYIVQTVAVALGFLLILAPIVIVVLLAFVGPLDRSTPMTEVIDQAGRPLAVAGVILLPLYVYLATGIVFMQGELAHNDHAGPIDAVLYSWRIARGNRWRIIGVGLVAGLIWIGSAMMCGIGLLFGGPFTILLMAALYLALREGADVPRVG